MFRAKVNDIEIAYQIRGHGPPLLMVHGFPLDHSMWRFQFEVLATRYQVISPDLRGFGQSSRGRAPISMKQFAHDLAGLLDTLTITQPITYCGLSMGGYIGWEFWKHYPSKIHRLIQCDTRSAGDSAPMARGRRQMAARITEQGSQGSILAADTMIPRLFSPQSAQATPERVSQLRDVIASSNPQMIAETQLALASRNDASTWLPKIQIPTLLICGELDQISPVEQMQTMAEALPDAALEIIDGVGHMAPLENPQKVNEVIRRFLWQTTTSC